MDCALCTRESSELTKDGKRPKLHLICGICGKQIHGWQSRHSNGDGHFHVRCEIARNKER